MKALPATEERRRFHRILFDAIVTIESDGCRWQTQLIDISLNGVLTERPALWHSEPDMSVCVTVVLSDGTELSMHAHVAHCEKNTVGFQCDAIDVESVTHLRRLIELNLRDPQVLHRELHRLGRWD